jgi:hypothetical protein
MLDASMFKLLLIVNFHGIVSVFEPWGEEVDRTATAKFNPQRRVSDATAPNSLLLNCLTTSVLVFKKCCDVQTIMSVFEPHQPKEIHSNNTTCKNEEQERHFLKMP